MAGPTNKEKTENILTIFQLESAPEYLSKERLNGWTGNKWSYLMVPVDPSKKWRIKNDAICLQI